MQNRDLMLTLFTINDRTENMRWETQDGRMIVSFDISSENEEFIGMGREMFRTDILL